MKSRQQLTTRKHQGGAALLLSLLYGLVLEIMHESFAIFLELRASIV